MWVHVPGITFRSFQEPADLTLALILPCPEAALSLTWRGKPMPLQSWQRAWRTHSFLRLLSGLTCAPSTVDRGVASWMQSLADSRVRTSATPADGQESLTASGRASGLSSSDWYARYDPATCSWRTSAHSFIADLTLYSAPLPKQGSMRNGYLYPQRRLALPISANGYSSWPTPDAGAINDGNDPENWRDRLTRLKQKHGNGNGNGAGTPLAMAAQLWRSPNAQNGERGADHPLNRSAGGHTVNLQDQALMWQTPATDAFRSRGRERKDEQGLDQQARFWATPMAWDGSKPSAGNRAADDLTHQAQMWTTPNARDADKWHYRIPGDSHQVNLSGEAANWGAPSSDPVTSSFSRPDQQTSNSGTSPSVSALTSRPRLNPNFVDWLMGWPPGWTMARVLTDSERQEMAWWCFRRRSHFVSYCNALGLTEKDEVAG